MCEEGTVCSLTSTDDGEIQHEMVMANWLVIFDEISCSLKISHRSVYQIIYDTCAKRVPKDLIAENKRKHEEVCIGRS